MTVALENGNGEMLTCLVPTTWQERALMFSKNGLLHRNVIIALGLVAQAQCWQTTLVHPRVLRFLSWLNSCALAPHAVARTKKFPTRMHSSMGSRTCPANAGTRNLRGLTRSAHNSILQSGWFKLYRRNQIGIMMEIIGTSQRSVRVSVFLM